MSSLVSWLENRPWLPVLGCLLVLPAALLLHLGLLPLIADEPIRALVALELKASGNLFVSTLQGEYYFNKPPLFNWLLLGLMQLFGSADEWVVRLPTVGAVLGLGGSLYGFVGRRLGRAVGLGVALAFVTSGRVLFYDSFLGLIDTLHTLVTYLGFVAVFELGERRRWKWLFAASYALTAVGFLLKGLPSLVFQGAALAVYFLGSGGAGGQGVGPWRKLFSGAHALGVAVLAAIVGGYFAVYSRHHPLGEYLATLLDQSTQRTVAAQPWHESAAHLLKYPFDFIFNFLPWTLLLLCLARPGWWRILWAHPFLRFHALLFALLTPVFWLSPATIPRYLFVLLPSFFTVVVYFYEQFRAENRWPRRVLDGVLLAVLVLASAGVWAVPFVPLAAALPGVAWKTAAVALPLAACAGAFWRLPAQRLAWLGLFLLVLRVGFNWFVLPLRLTTRDETAFRAGAVRVAQIAGREPVYKLADTRLDNDEAFYITRGTGHVVYSSTSSRLPAPPAADAFYLAEDRHLVGRKYREYHSFIIDGNVRLHLVKFN